jgi:hypothetical protein
LIDDDGLEVSPFPPPREQSVHSFILAVLREAARRPLIHATRVDPPSRTSGRIGVDIQLSAAGLTSSESIFIDSATLGNQSALNLPLARVDDIPYGSSRKVGLLFPDGAVRPGGTGDLVVRGPANSGQVFEWKESGRNGLLVP